MNTPARQLIASLTCALTLAIQSPSVAAPTPSQRDATPSQRDAAPSASRPARASARSPANPPASPPASPRTKRPGSTPAFGPLAILFASPVKTDAPPKAMQLVSAQLTQSHILRAQFTQLKKLQALRFPLRSKGRFLFSGQYGIAWHFVTPFSVSFVVTPQQIIQRANGTTTRITSNRKPLIMGFTRMFLTIFRGSARQLHQHFQVYFQGTTSHWRMGLRPKHPMLRKIFRHIVLQGSKTIERVLMAERSGDHMILQFSQINTTPLTAKERAQFTQPTP